MERGGWKLPHTVCYQSRVGSGRWLQPSIHEIIPRLGAEGCRNVLVVPVSFVSDHIETLHEIGIEVREEARQAGIERFELMPGLNDTPPFIVALAELVQAQVSASVAR
jgi:ferrochelatase